MAAFERRDSATVGIGAKNISGLTVEQVQQSLLGLLPDHQDSVRAHLIRPFCPSDEDYERVRERFEENLQKGLAKDTHAGAFIKMYPTYVRDLPDGSERGQYLCLDFSGVNFRVELVTLTEAGMSSESKSGVIPNRLLNDKGETLFDYLAAFLHRFLSQQKLLNTKDPLQLGFGFSFPVEPQALNKGRLVRWAKHFHCEGVVDQEVVGMLQEAINKKGEMNVECTAIISDTVGTLMMGAVADSKCSIGVILGKGTNACYVENLENVETWDGDQDDPKQVVINTEWRGFGEDGCLDHIRSEYDIAIDENCKHKGFAIYEKMVSSLFLGEMVRLALQKLKTDNVLFDDHWSEEMNTPNRFYAKYISEVLSEEDIRFRHTRHVFDDLHLPQASEMECRVLHHVCQLASVRSATLTAIGLACLINRMGRKEVAIAVDGGLFRFHTLWADVLKKTIPKYLNNETKFWFVPTAEGTGKGAALVAAVADRLKHGGAEPKPEAEVKGEPEGTVKTEAVTEAVAPET